MRHSSCTKDIRHQDSYSKKQEEKAFEVFREILGTDIWTAGVYLMAEGEVMRQRLLP